MNRNVAFVFTSIFGLFCTQAVAFVLVPLLALSGNMRGAEVGSLVGVLAGISVITDIVVATAADRIGRRPPMLTGAVLGIAAGILLGLGTTFAVLLAGALTLGFAFSLSIGPAFAYLSEAYRPEGAARIQGYNGAILGASGLVGVLLVSACVDRFGPRTSSWLIVGLMTLVLVSISRLEEATKRSPLARSPLGTLRGLAGGYGAALRLLRRRPQLQLGALISLIFNSVCFVSGNSFLPVYVAREGRDLAVGAGLPLALRSVAMVVSSPLFRMVTARLGFGRTLIAANVLAVSGVFGVALVDVRLVAIPLTLQGIGMGMSPAMGNILTASATAPSERALGFATNSFVARGGSLLTPILFGVVMEALGARAVFIAAGSVGLVYLAATVLRVGSVTTEV